MLNFLTLTAQEINKDHVRTFSFDTPSLAKKLKAQSEESRKNRKSAKVYIRAPSTNHNHSVGC